MLIPTKLGGDILIKTNLLILVLSVFLFVQSGLAATHYIDFATGADTNNGTAKSTPWKHAPGMPGCSNTCSSYTMAVGDNIIFKGGTTWASTSLPLNAPRSGSAGNPIYYGVDTTWYSGTNSGTVNTNGTLVQWVSGNAFQMNGSWTGGSITINGTGYTIASVPNPGYLYLTSSAGTQSAVAYSNSLFVRPVFNGGGATSNLMNVTQSYVTVDSIEFTGEQMGGVNDASLTFQTTAGNLLFENLDMHNWTHGSVTDNSGIAGGIHAAIFSGLSGAAIQLLNSNVGDPENGSNVGGIRGIQTLVGNYLHDMSFGIDVGGYLVHDNIFRNIGNNFDGLGTHTDNTYLQCFDGQCSGGLSTGIAYFYNNWIIDVQGNAAATAIYPNPGTSGMTSSITFYIFNNVISCSGACDANEADDIDPFGAGSQTMNVYDWNNTYQINPGASGPCVVVDTRSPVLSLINVQNLHCIAGTGVNFDSAISQTSNNITTQSIATANGQGYTSPRWSPTSVSGSTVGTGVNLSSHCSGTLAALCNDTTLGGIRTPNPRPSGGPWDKGAYQFAAANGPAPPTGLTATAH